MSLMAVNAVCVCLLLFLFTLNGFVSAAGNNYTIALWHGFIGWGRDEMLGFKYWGGLHGDLQDELIKAGFHTVTAAVGPVSSSWDRACEFYAQMVGTKVDYGLAHSQKYGHDRFGRDFTGRGLYPQWGKMGSGGLINKIHVIAHSQGGQDARILSSLLAYGSEEEREASAGANSTLSPLFEGGFDMLGAVLTVSSPHDGTSLATSVNEFLPFVQQLVVAIAGLAGLNPDTDLDIYDFKLDQWGLQRQKGENLLHYINRIMSSSIWSPNEKDISLYTLSPDGAWDMNGQFPIPENTFHITYRTSTTHKVPLLDTYVPEVNTFLVLWPVATWMGEWQVQPYVDKDWFNSDGVVNTVSQDGPKLNSNDTIVYPTGTNITLQSGVWNCMQLLNNWDHISIIGNGLFPIREWYTSLAQLLLELPVIQEEIDRTASHNAKHVKVHRSEKELSPLYRISAPVNPHLLERLSILASGIEASPLQVLTAAECLDMAGLYATQCVPIVEGSLPILDNECGGMLLKIQSSCKNLDDQKQTTASS